MNWFLIVLLMLLSAASAEVVDIGLVQEVDEFTGESSCYQTVVHSVSDKTGIGLMKFSSSSQILVYILSNVKAIGDNAFNMFGVMMDDLVYVRFPDGEVLTHEPEAVSVEVEFTKSGFEMAGITSSNLAHRLMSSPGDVRVRFDGSSNTVDFTIRHEVIMTLAAGFGQQCL
jgi:hypothetical protein